MPSIVVGKVGLLCYHTSNPANLMVLLNFLSLLKKRSENATTFFGLFLKNKKEAADKKARPTILLKLCFLLVIELILVCLHFSAFGK